MSAVGAKMTYRRLRAPQHPGQVLVDPPAHQVGDAIATNRMHWQGCEQSILGVPLHRLAHAAREHLLDAAFDYTTTYRQPAYARKDVGADTPLILSGHQPRLFHPGVWFKNFVLHSISTTRQSVGVHLIVDNDLSVGTSIRVPSGTAEAPQQKTVAFDQQSAIVPFEARKIGDPSFFASFPQRVRESLGEMLSTMGTPARRHARNIEPSTGKSAHRTELIVDRLWEHAIAAAKRSDNLGMCLSQARHLLEAEYGLDNLEVPLSRVCDHPSFLQFAAYLLQSPQKLREQYGSAILEYRATHGLRSQSHPGGGNTQHWRLPLTANSTANSEADGCVIGRRWQTRLQENGLRLRPRALITTMYARVFLSDLFLHGIGGAKYDQVTDQLIAACLGMTPPTFMTVTATMHLPVARHAVDADELRQLNGMLRELWFHPETMLPDPGADQAEFQAELKKKKKKLLANIPPRGQRKAWNDDLMRNNTQLRELAKPLRSILIQQRSDLIQRLRGDSILSSREYAFCLFSRQLLGQNLLDMAASVS